jgi:hypothetical protein
VFTENSKGVLFFLISSSRGQYGRDIFTFRSIFVKGQLPKSVNMYWRRFALSSIPLEDPEKFDLWIRKIWVEKDAFLEQYAATGRFPGFKDTEIEIEGAAIAVKDQNKGFIETDVRQAHWWDFLQIFVVLVVIGLVANVLAKVWNVAFSNMAAGSG